jgi:hypothetical protein
MKLALTCFSCLLLSSPAFTQEVPHFTADIGGGFTTPLGTTGSNLNTGWNIQGGVGYNFSAYFGTKVQAEFDDLGISSGALSSLGYPGGDVHVLSATVDPIVHLTPKHPVDLYVIGGGGLYHVYQEFTQPTVIPVTGYNPFFGFYTAGVPGSQVLASYSVNKPGWNGGVGVSFGAPHGHGRFFAEARYDHVYMTHSHMDFLPVSFGFRW